MFGKEIDGIEVYQVGKLQLWTWCSWSRHGYDYARSFGNYTLYCNAESLAKGKYVVLEGTVEFGRIWSKPWVVASYGSLKKAVAAVKDYQEYEYYKLGFQHSLSGNAYTHFYEIWQICDDDELWTSWIYDSALSLEVSDEDFDELADDVFPFGDCWDACIDACTPACDGDSEKAETKSETIMEKANRLGDEAQGNYDLYGGITSGLTDLCDYLGIHWDEYDELADDAKHAIQDFWRKLVVWDNRYSRFCWNILIDDDMTADLLKEHYSARIWHNDGSLRFREC